MKIRKLSLVKFFGIILLGIAMNIPLLPNHAFAAKFANQFVEFELPPQWDCHLEGAEWVCQSSNDLKKRDAIIVLAAKLKGDQDGLDQYLSFLKGPKIYTSVQGKKITSDAKYAKRVQLNDQDWVDSLHSESEMPGFFTRYLATVKSDIGVLVTYSIHKAKYQQYVEDFESLVRTLKVFRKTGPLNPIKPAEDNLFATKPIILENAVVFPGTPKGGTDTPPSKPREDGLPLPLLAIAGILGFIIWKKRKNSA